MSVSNHQEMKDKRRRARIMRHAIIPVFILLECPSVQLNSWELEVDRSLLMLKNVHACIQ